MQNDTIAGIASGMGGGIGIIRVSGEECLEIVGKVYRNKRYTDKYLKDREQKNIGKIEKEEWDNK